MGLSTSTSSQIEPVSLLEAKAHCYAPGAHHDETLRALLTTAREHIETATGRALVVKTAELTLDYGWPLKASQPRIVLPYPPLRSVTSITYFDQAGAEQTLAADQYQVAKSDTGEWAIEPAYGVTWPLVQNRLAAITVTFDAGYGEGSPAPAALKHAMLLLVAHWFANREAVNVGNIVSEYPLAVQSLIFPYRVFY